MCRITLFIDKMSISEADECSHDEAAKLIVDNSINDQNANRKKSKERKSVRISDDEITFFPSDDSGYTTCGGENAHLLGEWTHEQDTIKTIEEWTEEVFGNDSILEDLKVHSHDTILKNKVTFCDTPKATENNVEQSITYSEILVLDSPPSGHKPIHRSVSLESRDNPFMPGGSLDQEAADILKRATIIRDQFILNDNESYREQNSAADNTENKENNSDEINACQESKTDVVEEIVSPQSVNSTQTLPETKQNGKLEEKNVSTDSQPVEVNSKDGTLDRSFKDKKKQKKCCSLM